jgi:hypothetical protein
LFTGDRTPPNSKWPKEPQKQGLRKTGLAYSPRGKTGKLRGEQVARQEKIWFCSELPGELIRDAGGTRNHSASLAKRGASWTAGLMTHTLKTPSRNPEALGFTAPEFCIEP